MRLGLNENVLIDLCHSRTAYVAVQMIPSVRIVEVAMHLARHALLLVFVMNVYHVPSALPWTKPHLVQGNVKLMTVINGTASIANLSKLRRMSTMTLSEHNKHATLPVQHVTELLRFNVLVAELRIPLWKPRNRIQTNALIYWAHVCVMKDVLKEKFAAAAKIHAPNVTLIATAIALHVFPMLKQLIILVSAF